MENTVKDTARVILSAEAWSAIDRMLAELQFRIAAPIVSLIQQTGGVVPVVPAVPIDLPKE